MKHVLECISILSVASAATLATTCLGAVDLTPLELTVPEVADARAGIQVTWKAINNGKTATDRPFYDRIFISTDAELGSTDIVLGQTEYKQPVASGETYTSGLTLTVPSFPPGQYYLIVYLDSYYTFPEESEANNTLAKPIKIRVPDLERKTLKAPDIVDARETIQVDWEAGNSGDTVALPPWYDRIYLSTDAQLSYDDRQLNQTQWTNPVPAGSSYASSMECYIPAVVRGNYFLILELDPYGKVFEVSEANNTLARAIQIRVPDLVTKTLKAPDIVDARETIQVDWEAGNSGDTVALPPWHDRIYLSTDAQLSYDDRQLNQTQWTNPVPAGSSYASTMECYIPAVVPGNYFLILELDPYGKVFEVSEANNTLARAIQIRVPDLVTKTLKAPDIVDARETIQVDWEAGNSGDTVALPPWYDRIYLSTDAQLSYDDRQLNQMQWTNPVPAGSGYASSMECYIPPVVPGNYFLILELDPYGNVFEVSEANNTLARALQIRVPDLVTKTLKAPDIVDARETIQVDWEAGNSGDTVALPPWHDRIYLSTDAQLSYDDRQLNQMQRTNPVPAGSGYASSMECYIPPVVPGNYFLILELDPYSRVFEVSEANNTLARPIQIRVPDLKATDLKAPSYVEPAQQINVTCIASNAGDAVTLSPWYDRVYLSTDAQISYDDRQLGQTQRTNPVPAGSNYVSTIACTIPNVALGQYYLIAELDAYGNVFEITETNNILARAITLGPRPVPLMTLISGKSTAPRELRLNPPTGTKRIELRLNGQLICTVYGSMKTVDLADALTEAGASLVAGKNMLSASAFADDGTMLMGAEVDMSAWTEGMQTSTEILEPEHGFEIYSSGSVSSPVDILLRVRAATQRMAWPGSGRTGVVESPMGRVLFYIDGEVVHTSTNGTPEDDFVHEYNFHSSGLDRGRHVFYARSDPPEGYRLSADSRAFYVTNAYPVMRVSRTVTQHSNWFAVTLEIRNTGPGHAYLQRLEEVATGFQICNVSSSTAVTEPNPYFDFVDKRAGTTVEFTGEPRLNSNEVCTVEYRAAPIMFQTDTTYQFGGGGRLEFSDPSRTDHEIAPLVVTDTAYRSGYVRPRTLREAVAAAFRGSDYLLVTSPNGLGTFFGSGAMNVYTNMAELATLRNGVLGYFNGISRMHTGFRHGDLVSVGNTFGNWKSELWVGRPADNTVHSYSETGELSLGAGQLPIRLGEVGSALDLQAGDAMVVGNFAEGSSWPANRAEIAIARRDGIRFDIYFYDPDTETFSQDSWDTVDFYETGDALALADVIEGDDGGKDVILAKGDGEVRIWNWYVIDPPDITFSSAFRTGDLLATGYLLGLSHEQIVVGDKGDNRIHIYVLNDSGTDFFRRAYWSVTLDDGDAMAVGDVCGDGTDEIVVVDASANTGHVYGYTGTGFTFEEVATFSVDFETADRLLVGFFGASDKESILQVHGSDDPARPEGSVDIILLGSGHSPEDAYALDELLNEGGLWAAQLATNWAGSGFLLLVGDEGIVPAFEAGWDLVFSPLGEVDFTDRNYASTGTDATTPELCMGRISGNTADCLARALQTAIHVALDPTVLENEGAYCVSGANRGASGTSDDIDFTVYRDSIAEILRGEGFDTVVEEHTPAETNLLATAADKDVLFLAGHGWANGWDVLGGRTVRDTFVPSNAPIVYAASCLTGRYPDGWSLAESFLDAGASAYVGSTESQISVFDRGWCRRYAEEFFRRIEAGHPLGMTMKETVHARLSDVTWPWDPEYNAYHCAIIHYFGDPKMEMTFTDARIAGAEEPILDPAPELALAVPMYIVRSAGDSDMVEIPGEDAEVLEAGQPILPAYVALMKFPPGQKVQGVTLKSLSAPLPGPSLNLPIAQMLVPGGGGGTVTNAEPGWWPNMPFDWWTRENPDGSTTLRILAYAVQATNKTQIRFYSNYVFGITYSPSAVEIQQLSTDRAAYPTGSVVHADLHLRNSGQVPVDVTVQARVCSNLRQGTNDLAVPVMKQVQRLAWTRFEWSSAGSPPGPYTLEVVIRDAQGLLLDEAVADFQIGLANGEIAAFNLSPQDFQYGDDVQLSATFTNTGSTTLGGSIVIDLQDAAGVSVIQFHGDFTGVSPGGFFLYNTVWTNASLSPRNCRAVVYAQFGGQTTAQKVYADWQNAPLTWQCAAGADGTMSFRWYSVAGRRYTVEFTPDLGSEFTPVLVDQPASPPVNTFEHKPGPASGFYRLRETW